VQAGEGNASHWLSKFNRAYSHKIGAPVFPGSLNISLGEKFDWLDPSIVRTAITFERTEYGGERDILLVPCVLVNHGNQPAWLWTTTTALDRPDQWVVELIASTNLREAYGLKDGSTVDIQLLDEPHDTESKP
jgi:CTP-dependent riboflavin kinase